MIAMALICLIYSEKLTGKSLRIVTCSLYFSLVVDVIFLFLENETHKVPKGSPFSEKLYTFGNVMIYIGIAYKVFMIFCYLYV